MSSQIKVYVLPFSALTSVLRGEQVIANMPGDGQIMGIHIPLARKEACIGIYSASHPKLAAGEVPPRVTARLERRSEGRLAA